MKKPSILFFILMMPAIGYATNSFLGWYVGAGIGYGDTDWSYLCSSNTVAQQVSPSRVQDDGVAYNLFAQYIISANAAIKLNFQFMQYDARSEDATLHENVQKIKWENFLKFMVQSGS